MKYVVSTLTVLLLAASLGYAQGVYGTVVFDGGGPCSGALVTLEYMLDSWSDTDVTDISGDYAIQTSRVGPYRIRAVWIVGPEHWDSGWIYFTFYGGWQNQPITLYEQ